MSWNLVLNKVIEIKKEYIKKFGVIDYLYTQNETSFERWVKELGNQEHVNLIKPLQINQLDNLILIRYGKYSDVFGGEEDITYEEFWDACDGFYLECRSVVINVETEELVLCPFKKFRNINECQETNIENVSERIKNAKCIEFSNKLDGSMQSARFYNGKVIMSGSMALDPSNSWRLEDGYRMVCENRHYKEMLENNPDLTFIFEYISMKDAHVVNYSKEQEGLYLIGIRDLDGKEYSYSDIHDFSTCYSIKTTEVYNKTLQQVLDELDAKKSNEAEGFVLNIDGFKVKIKYNDYVNMHHMLSAMSSINLIIKNIGDDTFDDMLSKIPNAYRDRVMKVANIVYRYILITRIKTEKYFLDAPKGNKKEFMLWTDDNVPPEYKGYCRQLYLGNSINYIKSGNEKCPHYKRLKDMGVENYTEIFKEE